MTIDSSTENAARDVFGTFFVVLPLAIPNMILKVLGMKGFFNIRHIHEGGDPTDVAEFNPLKDILKKR